MCDSESSFRAMSASIYNPCVTFSKLTNCTLEHETFGSTASKALPMGFSNQRSVESQLVTYTRDAFLFVTKPHPEPFLGESGVCESGEKTEDEIIWKERATVCEGQSE